MLHLLEQLAIALARLRGVRRAVVAGDQQDRVLRVAALIEDARQGQVDVLRARRLPERPQQGPRGRLVVPGEAIGAAQIEQSLEVARVALYRELAVMNRAFEARARAIYARSPSKVAPSA